MVKFKDLSFLKSGVNTFITLSTPLSFTKTNKTMFLDHYSCTKCEFF